MDLGSLSNELVVALTPFLPSLLKLGESTATEMGKELGAEAGSWARELWQRLAGPLSAKPAAREAVEDVARNPDDEDARAALRLQLRKLLAEDEALAGELGRLLHEWSQDPRASVQVTAKGERSVAIGGDAAHSRISTGDQHDR
jgi:hypothetical protein